MTANPSAAHLAAPYLHWGVLQLSLANATVIAIMVVVFVLALVVPFPHGDEEEGDDGRG